MIVRRATPPDVTDVLRMIRALAAYEREPDAVRATEASLQATLFGPDARVFAHVAEEADRVIGCAVWFMNYSTWTGRSGLYVEDVIVEERSRGAGVGRALFRALAREAVTRGCARLDWAVLDWNEPAMRFYRALGGRAMSGWQPWRIDGPALTALAR